jgi:hypothetical protein
VFLFRFKGLIFIRLSKALIFMVVKKKRWTEEEVTSLALLEASLPEDTPNINQVLVSSFPHRTLKAVKGRRKKQDSREQVAELRRASSDVRMQPSADDVDDDDDDHPGNPNVSPRVASDPAVTAVAPVPPP